ncbi:MAG: esterase/lipase family protein [Pseudonocardiaceae bacterium]
MTICYVLPGLGGSELYQDSALTDKVWVSYTRLALGQLGRLRLAPDGASPGPPDGVQLYPGGPLPDYYGSAIAALAAALSPHGYSVVPWGYDWRLSTQVTGRLLADRIRRDVTAADPCSLVGHSLGGLVCRLAWASLVGTGESGLVRRIVTLGTPHWGSYGPVRIWSRDSEVSQQLWYISLASIAVFGGAIAVSTGRIWDPSRVAALTSTWPAVYETLPSLLAPDAGADPNRLVIYSGPWPSDRGVSMAWLDYARTVYQPLLASAGTLPPAWILTTVGGSGYATVSRLERPQYLGDPRAYVSTGDGDGQVVLSSAILPGSAQIQLTGAHGDLPVITAGLSQAAAVILDPRVAPDPPPPAQVLPGIYPVQLHGPPSPNVIAIRQDP